MFRGTHWSYVSSPNGLFVLLILVVVVVLIITVINRQRKEPVLPTDEEQIRYAIKKRYAAGEITKERWTNYTLRFLV